MQSLKGIRWGKHPPGMEQVTLSYNAATGGVDMSVDRVSNPNQPYKPVGMLKVRVLRLCGGVLGMLVWGCTGEVWVHQPQSS